MNTPAKDNGYQISVTIEEISGRRLNHSKTAVEKWGKKKYRVEELLISARV